MRGGPAFSFTLSHSPILSPSADTIPEDYEAQGLLQA